MRYLIPLLVMGCLGACGKKSRSHDRLPKIPDFPGEPSAADDWFNLDSTEGGININQVYAASSPAHDVIVAVIDSGVSTTHEDLKDHLWTNPNEIPDNGIDDDANGYVDDIHGWNYMVASDGSSIYVETYEVTRELRRLTRLQQQRELTESESIYLQTVQEAYDRGKAGDPFSRQYDLDWQQRTDDPDDFTPIDAQHPAYGNNKVIDDNSHGTHVAGIMAASRSNEVGIRGVADRARIMILKAVPDGDEQDKDIYHAVRYAVDHGARVINMSFGKDFSPHQDKVREAFLYAHEHDVLLVHAAGNSGSNMDTSLFFPSRAVHPGQAFLESWLDVGAVGRGADSPLAVFSNYGKANVDILAPGVNISSCVPVDSYAAYSGTSMAAPVVAGTAALMFSLFPDLPARELRTLMLESARTTGTDGQILPLEDKAIAGGVIDALALMQKIQEHQATVPQ
ncbi:S8 family serine peptidase [Oligoflexus tunisiensis]|uniref:S8 family serine peptidase n=1 Tax=Oligoflexus tunisiensis TaxID=708132 RepID=UPI000B1AF241|nr:S8 family serine peptidase [Oligoflexus tunisiensis]